MTTLEELEKQICERGIEIIEMPAIKHKSEITRDGDFTYIGVNGGLLESSTERLIVLSHELGHFNTNSLYDGSMPSVYKVRNERQANLDSVRRLLPAGEILRCILHGYFDVWDIAEECGYPSDFVEMALDLYQRAGELPTREQLEYLWD